MGEELTLFQRAILLSLSQIFLLAFGRRAEYWAQLERMLAVFDAVAEFYLIDHKATLASRQPAPTA